MERIARRHFAELTSVFGLELKKPPSDCTFRLLFLQMDP
jgi:hypothetical protein